MKSLLTIAFLMFYSGLNAQETLRLNDALRICLEHNYEIQVIKKNVEVSKNNNNIGNAGMLPTLNAIGSFSQNNSNTKLEFSSGDMIDEKGNKTDNLNAGLELNWTLFDGFGMFISKNKLEALEELSDIGAQLQIENTLRSLITLYYETARLKQNLLSLEENLEISFQRYIRAKDRVEISGNPGIELLNARVDLNQDSSSYLMAKTNYENARRNLNNIMGKNPAEVFEIYTGIDAVEMLDMDYFLDNAMKLNSSLMQALKDQEISQYDYQLVKSGFSPIVNFTSSYGYSKMTTGAGWMVLNQSAGLTTGISANINLFSGMNRHTQLQNAKINMEINKLIYEDLKNRILTNVYNNYALYMNQYEIWQFESENVQISQANYDRTLDLYNLGKQTSIDLRLAQLNLLNVKNNQNNAYFQLKIAESELMIISGKLFNDQL